MLTPKYIQLLHFLPFSLLVLGAVPVQAKITESPEHTDLFLSPSRTVKPDQELKDEQFRDSEFQAIPDHSVQRIKSSKLQKADWLDSHNGELISPETPETLKPPNPSQLSENLEVLKSENLELRELEELENTPANNTINSSELEKNGLNFKELKLPTKSLPNTLKNSPQELLSLPDKDTEQDGNTLGLEELELEELEKNPSSRETVSKPNRYNEPRIENEENLENEILTVEELAEDSTVGERNTPYLEARLDNSISQTTHVYELRDIQPTDWAYTALQSLIERYDCVAGYPDGTFRGTRSLNRYEFAAGLNACIQQIERLIVEAGSNRVTEADLQTIARLTQEFNLELANLSDSVDRLEGRINFLEENQFSTTVLFGGETIFALSWADGGDPPGTGVAEPTWNYSAKIGVVATFSGLDRLRVAVESGNFRNIAFAGPESLNTRTALLSFQGETDDRVLLSSLEYRTVAFSDRVVLTFKPVGFQLSDVLTANSAYFDAGRGSISRFAESSPVFKIGALQAGAGFDWLVTNRIRLQGAYGVRQPNNFSQGLFNSDHSALGLQVLTQPDLNVVTGVTYVNGYSRTGRLDTFTGSFNADTSGQLLGITPVQIHAINGSVQWRLSRQMTLGAWGGFLYSRGIGTDETAAALSKTYLFSLGIRDPFEREGDLWAVLVGHPPKLFSGTGPVPEDPGYSLHLETFYNWQINDHISITPGVFMVTEPGHISDNNSIFVGTLRTTFRF